MGSKDRWLSTIELVDVAMNIVAFEAINNVSIAVKLTVGDHHGRAAILLTATAVDRQPVDGEAKLLASASANCLVLNIRSLEAAVIHVLYLLDGELAKTAIGGEN